MITLAGSHPRVDFSAVPNFWFRQICLNMTFDNCGGVFFSSVLRTAGCFTQIFNHV